MTTLVFTFEANNKNDIPKGQGMYDKIISVFSPRFPSLFGKKGDAANNDGASGGPIKAKLGKENAFRYDEKLKRWVNTEAGSSMEEQKPPTAPPMGGPSGKMR